MTDPAEPREVSFGRWRLSSAGDGLPLAQNAIVEIRLTSSDLLLRDDRGQSVGTWALGAVHLDDPRIGLGGLLEAVGVLVLAGRGLLIEPVGGRRSASLRALSDAIRTRQATAGMPGPVAWVPDVRAVIPGGPGSDRGHLPWYLRREADGGFVFAPWGDDARSWMVPDDTALQGIEEAMAGWRSTGVPLRVVRFWPADLAAFWFAVRSASSGLPKAPTSNTDRRFVHASLLVGGPALVVFIGGSLISGEAITGIGWGLAVGLTAGLIAVVAMGIRALLASRMSRDR